MKKLFTGPAVFMIALVMLVIGLCMFVQPADAGTTPTPGATYRGVPVFAPVRAVAPNKRVIEVVDKVVPSAWRVSAAVNWLDRYTASDMRLVSRCSGKAYRCITVRSGKVKAGPVGWSQGNTITIDTGKAASGKYRVHYRQDKNRTWLLIHELAHQHGLGHSVGRNVMSPYVNQYRMAFTAGQKKTLRSR